MAKREKTLIDVSVDGYLFHLGVRGGSVYRVVVACKEKKNNGELAAIAQAYEKCRRQLSTRKRAVSLTGEFRWCLNPQCPNAFYAKRSKINIGQGRFCSKDCASRMTIQKWPDERIRSGIQRIYLEEGRVTAYLLRKRLRPLRDALKLRVKKGRFANMPEALKAISGIWFLDISDTEARRWLVDTACLQSPELIKDLDILLVWSKTRGRAKLVCAQIKKDPNAPVARKYLEGFLQTAEGGKLREALKEDPSFS